MVIVCRSNIECDVVLTSMTMLKESFKNEHNRDQAWLHSLCLKYSKNQNLDPEQISSEIINLIFIVLTYTRYGKTYSLSQL